MSYNIKISQLKRLISRTDTALDLVSTMMNRRTNNSIVAATETLREARHLIVQMTPVLTAVERVCVAQDQQNKTLKTAAAAVSTCCCVLSLLALIIDISFVKCMKQIYLCL